MERFSQRENVLLGYSSSPKTPFKDREMDFNDVFGGPPRRSSLPEMRSSFTETMNSTKNSTRGEEEEDTVLPVFGEETVNRRRYHSDDFFDDIFRGDESVSSPRRSNNDSFGSNPGSRVLSPARPLPPRADVFGTSLPGQSQFSLPAKLTKAMDFPVSASSIRNPYKHKDPTSNGVNSLYTPSSPLSRLSNEAFHEEDELRNETRSSHRPSPSSNEFSLSSKESSNETKSGESEPKDIGGNLKKDLKPTEAPSNSIQFHFSIYKWASKGVPLLLPLRGGNYVKSEERAKTERSSSSGRIEIEKLANGLQKENWCDSDLHFPNRSVSAKNGSPKQERGSLVDKVEPCHIVDETVLSMPGSKPINKIPNIVETVPGDAILCDRAEEIKAHSLSETGFCESTEKGISVRNQEAKKPELMSLRSLLYATDYDQGNDDITRKPEGEDLVKTRTISDSHTDVSKNVKKHEKRISSNRAEVTQVEVHRPSHDSNRKSGDNVGKNRVKGKVKGFVKIFSQEAAPKSKINVETRSKSYRWKISGTFGEDKEQSANTTQTHEKNHVYGVKEMKTPQTASITVDKNLDESEKQQSPTTKVFDASENSFGQEDPAAISSDSYPDDSKVAYGIIDDLFQGDFTIKELSNEVDKPVQSGDGYEDIQTSNAEIRKWSNGKEGNIRSLLSTLQYVLWPGSGWKPVPLVDIIEGSAVKRAYQKALLCLHPDKLQQKGAAAHQKYIAEKVFDILQEAWDHFNSLGAI